MPMEPSQPQLTGVHLFVRDMAKALEFYELLGLTPSRSAGYFANIDLPGGLSIALGTYELTKAYDPGWREPGEGGTNALQLSLASREAVDALYEKVAVAGHRGRLAPFDAFWGSRYAEVVDPDGNVIGFQSPADDEHRAPPPL
jgi:uncharacterized glyoxalase superfamily protein PhnB